MGLQRLYLGLVLLVAGSALACNRAPSSDRPPATRQPTTTYSFSIASGSLPSVLFMGRERSAELVLRNDGFNAWTGGRTFFFSPTWLAGRGGRSIQEGFRTPIPAAVDPGEEVPVRVRVKPPDRFGLYRIQWDVLSDLSGPFARFDRTPEPLRWALVLPPVEFVLAVLIPCLLAAVALAIRKRSSLAASGLAASGLASACLASLDLAWCGASLLGKPYVLYSELAPKFWPGPKLVTFSVVAALLLPIYFLPSRIRPIAAWLLAALGTLLVWTQLIYFRFFRDLASSVAFLAGRQATDLGATVRFLAKPTDLWLLLDLIFVILVWWRVSKDLQHLETRPRKRAPAVFLAALALPFILSGALALTTGHLQDRRNLQNLRSVSSYGLYGFQLLDGGAHIVSRWRKPKATAEDVERVLDWFEETRPQRESSGPNAGAAKGLNLIAIQVESMQSFVVDLDIDGTPVMPALRRLRAGALEFSQVLDQTSRGRSSAGDFVTMTSMIPIGESVAYEYPKNHYYSIAHALTDRGYKTLSAIPYKGNFWNRQATHPAYGFEQSLFQADFVRTGPRVGWGINDTDFLHQIVPVVSALDEPFFAWLTTLSLHYPYESFPSDLESRSMGELEGTRLGNYLHGMNLFDRALGKLFADLESEGLLDRTVVAIWGDHGSGLLRDPLFVDFFGLDLPVKRFLFDTVPFMVWLPPDRSIRRVDSRPAGQVDIAPTLLALLGVDPGNLALMGHNLLRDSKESRVVTPQGKWLDRDLIFLSQFADREESACFSTRKLKAVAAERCSAGSQATERQLDIVSLVLQHDLQAEISRRLASR